MHQIHIRPWLSLIAAFVLVAWGAGAHAGGRDDGAPAFGAPVISLRPAGLQLEPGASATARVWLEPGERSAHGVSFELTFDPGLIQVDDVIAGALLGEDVVPGRNSPQVDNRRGKLRFEAVSGSGAMGGAGALCEFTVRASGERTADRAMIHVRKATLLDAVGKKVEDVEARRDGSVEQVRFPGARIVRDPSTGLPSQVIGIHAMPRQLVGSGDDLTEANAGRVLLDFLDEHADLFGVATDDLRLAATRRVEEHWLVAFRQVRDKLPVHHVAVTLIASESGEVLAYHSNYVPDLRLPTRTRVELEEAGEIAKATYDDGAADAFARQDAALVVHVDRSGDAPVPHLAWRFLLAGERPRPDLDAFFFVDTQDGTLLHSYPRFVPAALRGSVKGQVFAESPDDPASMQPLAHLDATAADAEVVTDPGGRFVVGDLLTSYYDVEFSLSGPYARVRSAQGDEISSFQRCHTSEPCDVEWTGIDLDGSNVFFHINWMHDWYVGRLGHSWASPWDDTTRVEARVGLDPRENAWAGDTLLFGADAFARSSDVVYHECSHNVLAELYGDWIGFSVDPRGEGYALDEGFADYFAAAATDDPRVGEGCGEGHDLSAAARYPGRGGYDAEGHEGGKIIGGAAWALRKRLEAEMGGAAGARYADRLLFEAHRRLSMQPRAFHFSDPRGSNLLSALYAADAGGVDPFDRAPHFGAIQRAFGESGLLQAVLADGDSFDVSSNLVGSFVGGDFYLSDGQLLADNPGQGGVLPLGDLGDVPLGSLEMVHGEHERDGHVALPGWVFQALAQEGEVGRRLFLRVRRVFEDGSVAIEYDVRDRQLILASGQGYDFSEGLLAGAAAADLSFSGGSLRADVGGQRGLVDLGDLGDVELEGVVSPPSGYQGGVAAVVGHTYVARAATGEEGYEIPFRVVALDGGEITFEAVHRKVGRVLLYQDDVFDFGDRIRGRQEDHDVSLARGKLCAGGSGLVDLGETGEAPLHRVQLPADGYTTDCLPSVEGHTYAAKAAGDEGSIAVFRIASLHGTAAAVDFVVLTPGFVTLYDGDGYDFAERERGTPGVGELSYVGGQLQADGEGQRGLIDLGETGDLALDAVAFPATGYTRSGVAAVAGHTYAALTREGGGASYVVFRVHEGGGDRVRLEWTPVTPGTVVLRDRESFDFSEGIGGSLSGGELYLSRGKLHANQRGQRGLVDLGELEGQALQDVEIPDVRFGRSNVPVVAGHTYVALAGRGEEGNHVVFRVEAVDEGAVTLRYSYRAAPGADTP